MYCIINWGFKKQYLAFQNTGEEIQYGYYPTDKDTFLMNLGNNKKEHPILFKTELEAENFIEWLSSVRYRRAFIKSELSYEWIDSSDIPKCNMECWKCNKKKKHACHHLRNPYQNICAFIMARFDDGFKPDPVRLDAPCEKCLTKGCVYNNNR